MDGLIFSFPSDWQVAKYDETAFYRQQFQSFAGGSQAVDIVALAGEVLWLIEVKDYRRRKREKSIGLADEVALKVRSTLAGLATARVRANDDSERQFARRAMLASQLRVALHLEQSKKPSRLFPRAAEPKAIRLALKKALHPVDAHPILVSQTSPACPAPWSVVTFDADQS